MIYCNRRLHPQRCGGHAQGAPAHRRALLDERHFRRIDKFSNKEVDGHAWQSNVEVAIAAVHLETSKVMEEISSVGEVSRNKLADICKKIAGKQGHDREKVWIEMMTART